MPDPTTAFEDLCTGGIYLGLIALVGYTILCALLTPGKRAWHELLGLSFACGAGAVPLVLFFVSIAGVKPSRWTLLCIALSASAGLIFIRRKNRLLRPTVPTPFKKFSPTSILGAFALALILVLIFNVSARAGGSMLQNVDAFAIWLFKAKWIMFHPLVPMPGEFHDPSLSYSHQDYPLGFPFLVAGLWAMVGRVDDSLMHIVLVPIYLALICVMYSAIRRIHSRAIALTITAIFIAAPDLTYDAGCGVPESFLILSYASAMSLLLRWIDTNERGDLLLAGVFMAIAAFIKNEGLALLPVIGLAAIASAMMKRNRKPMIDCVFAVIVSLLLISPWLIYRTFLPRTHEDYGGKFTHPATILRNLPRMGYVFRAFFGQVINAPRLGPVWWLLALIAFVGYPGFRRGPVLLLWSILLIQMGLYIAAFLVTPWDVSVLLPMVTPRLLTQASPIAALLISRYFHDIRSAFTPRSTELVSA